jgi:hypothetical protein
VLQPLPEIPPGRPSRAGVTPRRDVFGCLGACYAVALAAINASWRIARRCLAAMAVAMGAGTICTFGPHAFNGEVAGHDPLHGILKQYLASSCQRYQLSGNTAFGVVYNDHDYVAWRNLVDDNYLEWPIPGRSGNWHGTARGRMISRLSPSLARVVPGLPTMRSTNGGQSPPRATPGRRPRAAVRPGSTFPITSTQAAAGGPLAASLRSPARIPAMHRDIAARQVGMPPLAPRRAQ